MTGLCHPPVFIGRWATPTPHGQATPRTRPTVVCLCMSSSPSVLSSRLTSADDGSGTQSTTDTVRSHGVDGRPEAREGDMSLVTAPPTPSV
jgi:hypothetical protein